MFRVESANKLGLTSCTSLPCQWKVPSATTEIVPVKIKDLSVRKSRHGLGITKCIELTYVHIIGLVI